MMEPFVINSKNFKKIGKELAKIRELKGMSQEEVAKKMGNKRQSFVSGMENGPRLPSFPSLVLYLKAIDVKFQIG